MRCRHPPSPIFFPSTWRVLKVSCRVWTYFLVCFGSDDHEVMSLKWRRGEFAPSPGHLRDTTWWQSEFCSLFSKRPQKLKVRSGGGDGVEGIFLGDQKLEGWSRMSAPTLPNFFSPTWKVLKVNCRVWKFLDLLRVVTSDFYPMIFGLPCRTLDYRFAFVFGKSLKLTTLKHNTHHRRW